MMSFNWTSNSCSYGNTSNNSSTGRSDCSTCGSASVTINSTSRTKAACSLKCNSIRVAVIAVVGVVVAAQSTIIILVVVLISVSALLV